MKQSQFPGAQIVAALRRAQAGTAVVESCRALGAREQAFSRRERKSAGLGIAALRRRRQAEEENRKLKPLVAALSLDKHLPQAARGGRTPAGRLPDRRAACLPGCRGAASTPATAPRSSRAGG